MGFKENKYLKNILLQAINISILFFICLFVCTSCTKGCQEDEQLPQPVRIVSWGGTFQNDLIESWISPVAKSCGISFEAESWDGDYGSLTSRIMKGINYWDVVHVEAHYIGGSKAHKLFSDGGFNKEFSDILMPGLVKQHAIAVLQFGYVLAYRKDLLVDSPQDWTSYWNIEKYPGNRSMRDFPIGNIEVALLSLGIDPTKALYNKKISDRPQLETIIDKALDQIGKIQKNIIWWKNGNEVQQAIESGEVAMIATWSGRALSAHRKLCSNNNPSDCIIGVLPNTSLISVDYWVVPYNSPNAAGGIQFIKCLYSSSISRESARMFSLKQGYSNPFKGNKSDNNIANYYLDLGKTDSSNIGGVINAEFWSNNFEWINKRWQYWRSKH